MPEIPSSSVAVASSCVLEQLAMSPAPTNTASPEPPGVVTEMVWVTGVPLPAPFDGVSVTSYGPADENV